MSLILAAAATLGRLRYTDQIRSVRTHLGLLPGVNRVEIGIAAGVAVEAAPGAEAEVSVDGGDGAATIITGTVTQVERRAFATVVTVADAGAALAALRPTETYHGLPFAQIIHALASLAGVGTDLVALPGQTADWIPNQRRTAAEHVGALARLGGGIAHIGSTGRLTVAPWPVGIPDVAMRLDREFLTFDTHDVDPGAMDVLLGAGGSGSALAPDAWLPATAALETGGGPDAAHRRRPEHVLRTLADVRIATGGANQRRGAAARRMAATCWPQPARRPGDVVQIQETGDEKRAGPWLLTHVRHAINGGQATTTLLGIDGGPGGGGGPIGTIAGEVGSLL